jgi:hypothetical protein
MEMKIYDIFWRRKFMGKIMDFGEGLIDAIRDMNPEISVKETDERSFIAGDVVKDIIESQIE